MPCLLRHHFRPAQTNKIQKNLSKTKRICFSHSKTADSDTVWTYRIASLLHYYKSAFPFNSLAKRSSICSIRRVTVPPDKLIFSYLLVISGHKRPAVSTMHCLINYPSQNDLLACAILKASKKLALVIDS